MRTAPLFVLSALFAAASCSGSARTPDVAPSPPSPAAAPPAALPSAPPAAAPAPPTGEATSIRIPPRVAAFSLAARRDFEVPGAGSAFRYVGPDSLYADVYLYPGPDLATNCDETCAEQAVTNEAIGFETVELPQTVSAGTIRSYEVLSHDSLTPPEGAPWRIGRHIRFTLEYPDRPGTRRSDYYLYYMPFVRVKVRVTYVENPARNAALELFTRELLPALAPPGS